MSRTKGEATPGLTLPQMQMVFCSGYFYREYQGQLQGNCYLKRKSLLGSLLGGRGYDRDKIIACAIAAGIKVVISSEQNRR